MFCFFSYTPRELFTLLTESSSVNLTTKRCSMLFSHGRKWARKIYSWKLILTRWPVTCTLLHKCYPKYSKEHIFVVRNKTLIFTSSIQIFVSWNMTLLYISTKNPSFMTTEYIIWEQKHIICNHNMYFLVSTY